eukprot:4059147-Pleurochrysis_carterae.AAC.1
MEHALHCRSRLLIAHSFDSPSPRSPVFTAQGTSLPPNLQATTRQTRSQAQTAAPTAAPASASAAPSSGLPPLTADEAK